MKSYADLAAIWRRVDEEVASTPMPEEYACWVAHILCNDCNQVRQLCTATHHLVTYQQPLVCFPTGYSVELVHLLHLAVLQGNCLIAETKVRSVCCRQGRCRSTYWG